MNDILLSSIKGIKCSKVAQEKNTKLPSDDAETAVKSELLLFQAEKWRLLNKIASMKGKKKQHILKQMTYIEGNNICLT